MIKSYSITKIVAHGLSVSRSFYALAVPLFVSIAGCGHADPPQVPVFPVTGKIQLSGGETPTGARVVLYAVERNDLLPPGISPTGTVKKDGSFKISVYGEEDGAPPGEYKATVEWFKLVETGGEKYNGPNVLPREYSRPETTPLRVRVQSAPTELAPIEIPVKRG